MNVNQYKPQFITLNRVDGEQLVVSYRWWQQLLLQLEVKQARESDTVRPGLYRK